MLNEQPLPPRFKSFWSGGSFIVEDDSGNEVFRLEGSQLIGNLQATNQIPLSSLANVPVYEGGAPSTVTMITTGDCADAETVTIGDDIYVLRLLTTDTTEDTADGDFNNTDNPLVIPNAVTKAEYAAVDWTEGELIRVADEVMAVTYSGADHVHLWRGAGGTTIVAHANGVDIFQHATPAAPGAGEIYVGIVGTDADLMRAALIDDINSRGTMNLAADDPGVAHANEIYCQTATGPGGAYVPSDDVITVANTGANIEIESTTGHLPGEMVFGNRLYEVQAQEVTNGFVQISFGFTVLGFVAQVFDSSWIARNDLTDAVYAVENRVIFEAVGITNVAATDMIMVLAWGG